MIITKENIKWYKSLNIDVTKLKSYYIDRAIRLLKALSKYNDEYATALKQELINFIINPKKDLRDVIDGVKIKRTVDYNSFGINDTLFDIWYVDDELMEDVLRDSKHQLN